MIQADVKLLLKKTLNILCRTPFYCCYLILPITNTDSGQIGQIITMLINGRLCGLTGKALCHISLPPEFKSRRGHIRTLFHIFGFTLLPLDVARPI